MTALAKTQREEKKIKIKIARAVIVSVIGQVALVTWSPIHNGQC